MGKLLQLSPLSRIRYEDYYYYYYYHYYQCTDLSDAVTRTMQGHFTENSEEGSKKLAKTKPKQMCLQLLPKRGEG